MAEITLSTGKKIALREKKGQHHFIERRLMATSMGDGGRNIGGVMGAVTVSAIVSIDTVDGEKITTPTDEAGIFELMDRFSYEEWGEFEQKLATPEEARQLEEAAKNLQASPGSVEESK